MAVLRACARARVCVIACMAIKVPLHLGLGGQPEVPREGPCHTCSFADFSPPYTLTRKGMENAAPSRQHARVPGLSLQYQMMSVNVSKQWAEACCPGAGALRERVALGGGLQGNSHARLGRAMLGHSRVWARTETNT